MFYCLYGIWVKNLYQYTMSLNKNCEVRHSTIYSMDVLHTCAYIVTVSKSCRDSEVFIFKTMAHEGAHTIREVHLLLLKFINNS